MTNLATVPVLALLKVSIIFLTYTTTAANRFVPFLAFCRLCSAFPGFSLVVVRHCQHSRTWFVSLTSDKMKTNQTSEER